MSKSSAVFCPHQGCVLNDSAHTHGTAIRQLIQHPKKNSFGLVLPFLPIVEDSAEELHLADAAKQRRLLVEEGTRDLFLCFGITFERIQLGQLLDCFVKFRFFFFEFLAQSSIVVLGIGIVEPRVLSFLGDYGVSGLVSAFDVRLELLYDKIKASLHFVNGADLVTFEIVPSGDAAPPAHAVWAKTNGSSKHDRVGGWIWVDMGGYGWGNDANGKRTKAFEIKKPYHERCRVEQKVRLCTEGQEPTNRRAAPKCVSSSKKET